MSPIRLSRAFFWLNFIDEFFELIIFTCCWVAYMCYSSFILLLNSHMLKIFFGQKFLAFIHVLRKFSVV